MVEIGAGKSPDAFGPWQEVIVVTERGDGFWFNAVTSSRQIITLEIGTGVPGSETERADVEIHGHQHVLVFEPIPIGTRLAARIKSADPEDTVTVRAETWRRPTPN